MKYYTEEEIFEEINQEELDDCTGYERQEYEDRKSGLIE